MSRSFGRGGRGGNGGRGRNRGHVSGTGSSNVVPFLPHLRIEHVLKLYPVSEESWFNGGSVGPVSEASQNRRTGGLATGRHYRALRLVCREAGKISSLPRG